MNTTIQKALLNILSGVYAEKSETPYNPKESIKNGIIIFGKIDKEPFNLILEKYGLNGSQMNATFHKSWKKVHDTPQATLFIEQILHYCSTYGTNFEGDVYIPTEKLKIPSIKKDKIYLKNIKVFSSKEEIKEKIFLFLESGIALAEDTVKDIFTILEFTGIEQNDLHKINNREILPLIYQKFGLLPENNIELLRYIVFVVTGKTMLIKSEDMLLSIKDNISNNTFLSKTVNYILKRSDLISLSQIYNRFKDIFISLKTDNTKTIINKISRLSKKHHIPFKPDVLNSLSYIEYDKETIKIALKEVNIFRIIRLLNMLNERIKIKNERLYQIRNGKFFVKERNNTLDKKYYKKIKKYVYKELLRRLSHLKDKKFYIPDNIDYSLPSTEKRFIGEFPEGTRIKIDKEQDLIIGIYWENYKGNVDLDLSFISLDGKIGWNASHKNNESTVLYSGDMTKSKNGASECFYIKNKLDVPYMMFVNLYSGAKNAPYKIYLAHQKVKKLNKNYMVNPNKILLKTNHKAESNEFISGILIPTENGHEFVFTFFNSPKRISHGSIYNNMLMNYVYEKYTKTSISLKKILEELNVTFVKNKNDADFDLSPENITKEAFLNIMLNKK